ncbi:type III secretion system (T3SS) SseB-like protein [Tamaricihabitans halophyticus]|uniref:Type III secretion system (T3SS) SseB-like protein n=1 Tax=Tamaricihabitans halophyticus TaxID=1262583 RepID=A0A4R2R2C7_9PSEU|nr:type III secretion system (T3SS) SseB-like protein [Tamaricihabitans halophyticus]
MEQERAEQEWQAANDAERAIVAALADGDGQRLGQLLENIPLYLPGLDDDNLGAMLAFNDELPDPAGYVLLYTSAESLQWALGDLAKEYWETDLHTIRAHWPGPEHRLALNARTPIGIFLPIGALAQLAAGQETLVPAQDARATEVSDTAGRVRHSCLRVLRHDAEREAADLKDHSPTNELETELSAATEQQDSDGYLAALASADILVPTESQGQQRPADADSSLDLLVGQDNDFAAVPVFTSVDLLRSAADETIDWIQTPFARLIAQWPSDEHILCVNPGFHTELILPGNVVLSLDYVINHEPEKSEVDSKS